jgi:hypothetical protein
MPRCAQNRVPIVLMFVTIMLAAACAKAAPPAAPPASSASADHAPTPSSVPAATPPPATSRPIASPSELDLQPLSEGGSHVFPGRFTTHFEPALMLTIDRQVQIDCAPGYRCRGDIAVNGPFWLDLEFGSRHPIEIHIMSFRQVFDGKHPGRVTDPPADLTAWMSAMPDVTVTDVRAVRVGGLEATQLDLTTGSEDVPLGPTGQADLPALGFGAHQLRRVYLVRASGALVVIGLSPVNPEDYTPSQLAAAIDILQPIVDSITWR